MKRVHKSLGALLVAAILLLTAAACAPKQFTVTFEANGGSSVAAVTVAEGEAVLCPEDPVKEGFTFGGWYRDAACTQEFTFGAAITESLTLYAKWIAPDTVTITFDAQGGKISEALKVKTLVKGQKIGELPAPVKSGYVFGGWYGNAECTGDKLTEAAVMEENRTYYAKWTAARKEIATAAELLTMLPDGDYVLTADIDLEGAVWTPIGTREIPFTGRLDGAGHKIENLASPLSGEAAGLFGYLAGTVQNLTVTGTVTITGEGTVYAGGIAAYLAGGKISGCTSLVNVDAKSAHAFLSPYAGGIAGRNDAGTIERCAALGNISAVSTAGTAYAGGVVGYHGGGNKLDGMIADSYASGNVTAAGSGAHGAAYAGGLAAESYGLISRCFALGDVSATTLDYYAFSAGLVGDNNGGKIEHSFAAGNVSAKTRGGDTFTGYVAGRNFIGGTTESSFGFAGQSVTANPQDDGYLPYTRHARVNAPLASLADAGSAEWYRGTLGLGEAFQVQAASYPTLGAEEAKPLPESLAEGTPGNPVEIADAAAFAGIDCDKSYRLTADIDLVGEAFTPIGSYAKPYYGVFYGNGKTVTGISLTADNNGGYLGFFGLFAGTVKDLAVEIEIDITSEAAYPLYAGGIAGCSLGGVIEGCLAKGSVNVIAQGVYAGGLVGRNDAGANVFRCASEAAVTAKASTPTAYAGGLAAYNAGTLSESYSSGAVALTAGGRAACGGLAGVTLGTVSDCYATGNVTLSAAAASEQVYAGGLVGFVKSGIVANCYETGTVTANAGSAKLYAGGIAGYADGGITNSHWLDTAGDAAAKGVGSALYGAGSTAYAAAADMAGLAEKLGGCWKAVESGAPALVWQA